MAANCMDCGIDYGEFGMDTLMSNEQWRMIHPDDWGLLCASCIVKRASKLPDVLWVEARLVFEPGEWWSQE
jgi:hypothetical protein